MTLIFIINVIIPCIITKYNTLVYRYMYIYEAGEMDVYKPCSFNYREGLVLHNVGYQDQGRLRPVMHRFSLVEIIVPCAQI